MERRASIVVRYPPKQSAVFMGDFSCSIADAPAAPHAQAAALAQEGPKPVVAWINHFMYGTQEWYQLSFAAYKTELVEAAGGQNLNYTDILEIEGVCVCVCGSVRRGTSSGHGACGICVFGASTWSCSAHFELLQRVLAKQRI